MRIAFQSSDVAPATADSLRHFERRHGLVLPRDYRSFLAEQNGGRPVEDWVLDTELSRSIGGVLPSAFLSIGGSGSYDVSHYLSGEGGYGIDWIASGLLPIAEDPGGNVFCLSLRSDDHGAVFFWDHELGPHDRRPAPGSLTRIADTFSAFTEGLRLADEVEESS